jgi:teichuronic acid biosynthesis glycosyltransferase TuaG
MKNIELKKISIKSQPLVSVIIPVYNAEEYLEFAVGSVLAQKYPNIEIILIDDCSTDNSWKICCDFSSRFKQVNAFQSASNSGGPATPRNIGIRKTNGKYIAFLDADDSWELNKLESQVCILNAQKDIFAVCSYTMVVDKTGSVKGFDCPDRGLFRWVLSHFGRNRILFHNYIPMSSVIVRQEIFERLKFEEWKPIAGVEDWALWMRVVFSSRCNVVHMVQEPLIRYRDLVDSLSKKDQKSLLRKTYILHSLLYYEKIISLPCLALMFIYNALRCLYHYLNGGIRIGKRK